MLDHNQNIILLESFRYAFIFTDHTNTLMVSTNKKTLRNISAHETLHPLLSDGKPLFLVFILVMPETDKSRKVSMSTEYLKSLILIKVTFKVKPEQSCFANFYLQ